MSWWAVGSAVVGGVLSADAAGDAADAQGEGTAAATAEQRRQFDTTRRDYAPFRQVGRGALAQLASAYGIPGFEFEDRSQDNFDANAYLAANPDVAQAVNRGETSAWQHYNDCGSREGRKFTSIRGPETYKGGESHDVSGDEVLKDPGYAFGMQQGQQAIDRKIAAGGGRISGSAIKAAARFGTDYGSTKYGEAYQRRQDRLNRLAAIAGIGQTATAGSAAAGMNSANAISGILQNQGDNAGAARLATGNIWGNAVNQIGAVYSRQNRGGGVGTAFGNDNSYNAMDYGYG
jgi:hypothetical protein